MAYDEVRHQMVLFGGGTADDTWTWDTRGWKEQHPVHHPPATTVRIAAFDPVRQQVLLVVRPTPGVNGGTTTWTWDGANWQLHDQAHQPPISDLTSSLVAVPQVGRLLLLTAYKPTMAWDGSDWVSDSTPPPAVAGTVVYDARIGTLVNLGTAGGNQSPAAWELVPDKSASAARSAPAPYVWTQVSSAGPTTPDYPIGQAVYHEALGQVVYFQFRGVDAGSAWETWTWDAGMWTLWPYGGQQPKGFWRSSEAYDPGIQAIVLFGGGDDDNGTVTPRNETWVLAANGWTRAG